MTPVTSKSLVRNGIIAGAAGGMAIAAVGMVMCAARGTGFWALPNAIGGIVLGPTGRELGVATLVGVMLHMALSASYGVAVVFAARRITREYIGTAIAFALGLWLVNYYAIGAVLAGAHSLAELNPVWMGAGLHVLFGLVTGLFARTLDRR